VRAEIKLFVLIFEGIMTIKVAIEMVATAKCKLEEAYVQLHQQH